MDNTTSFYSNTYSLFNGFSFADVPEWVPYLPIPATYTHSSYGEIEITRDGNQLFVDNFNNGIYQKRVPIDAEHETKLSGAFGYITFLRMNEDGSVDARVEWTDRGREAIEKDRFKYFSPEWFSQWTDPMTEEVYENVIIGGALTTRPFFKEKALRPLVAHEGKIITRGEPMADDNQKQLSEMEARLSTLEKALSQKDEVLRATEAEKNAVAKQANELATQNKQLSERVEAMENANTQRRFNELVSNAGNQWGGQQSVHIDVLTALTKTYGEDSEQFKNYVEMQNGNAEQLQDSALFREIGSGASGTRMTASDELERLTSEKMKANPSMKYTAAYSAVLVENPDLYARHRKETDGGNI